MTGSGAVTIPEAESSPETASSRELDRLCELANIGAGHAATAFAQLAGRPVWMDVPRVRAVSPDAPVDPVRGIGTTGIFFEVDGSIGALLAILFEPSQCEAVAERLLGRRDGPLDPQAIKAVLTEVGNILASHVVSAIADTVGGKVMPSVPGLVMGDAARVLAERSEGRAPVRIESVLRDASGDLGGRLVLVPDRV